MPKRYGNLWESICDLDNIRFAHACAKQDKSYYDAVIKTDNNLEERAQAIRDMLLNHTYKVGMYNTSILYDRDKYRILFKLPYYPDRIIQWAIMLKLEPIFKEVFTNFTCASIPSRGIHYASNLVRTYMKDQEGTKYCLKIDIKKFYCLIDQKILKELLRKKIKDKDLLIELDKIIDSMKHNNLYKIKNFDELKSWYEIEGKGQPVGAYLSQYLANYYLAFFDHWLKEKLHIKYVVRYMDDIIIFSHSKQQLHDWFKQIQEYLQNNLCLTIKSNWQIFPTGIRGVDFVGYRHFYGYTLMRKKCFKNFKTITNKIINTDFNKITNKMWSGYLSLLGWSGWSNCYNYIKKDWELIMPKINYYYNLHKKSKKKRFNYVFMVGTRLYDKIHKQHNNIPLNYIRYNIHKTGGLNYGTIF